MRRKTKSQGQRKSSKITSAVALRVCRGGRENQPEAAALAEFRKDADFSAHAFGCTLYNGQAHAGAFVFPGRVEALKHQEHAALRFGWDAYAVVLKPCPDLAIVTLRPYSHARNSSLFDEFQRIADEVVNAL